MKQYTTPSQTAKLIELGFEKPRTLVDKYYDFDAETYAEVKAYSIGELLSFLPDDGVTDKRLEFDGFHWFVDWDSLDKIRQTAGVELIDAAFEMCVKLKEEGGR